MANTLLDQKVVLRVNEFEHLITGMLKFVSDGYIVVEKATVHRQHPHKPIGLEVLGDIMVPMANIIGVIVLAAEDKK